MRTAIILFVVVIATASALAFGASADKEAIALQTTSALAPQSVATPAAANSAQPQLSSSKRGVLLSWIERTGDLATLKFAVRTSTGWTAEKTIASGRDW